MHLEAISFIKLEDETVSLVTAKSRISSVLENLIFDLPEALLVYKIKTQELTVILLLLVLLLCSFTSVILLHFYLFLLFSRADNMN